MTFDDVVVGVKVVVVLLFAVFGLAVAIIGDSVSDIQVGNGTTALIAECEKALPRDQYCVLVAVPEVVND